MSDHIYRQLTYFSRACASEGTADPLPFAYIFTKFTDYSHSKWHPSDYLHLTGYYVHFYDMFYFNY